MIRKLKWYRIPYKEAVSSLLAAFITSEVVLNNGLEDVLLVTLGAEKAFDKYLTNCTIMEL